MMPCCSAMQARTHPESINVTAVDHAKTILASLIVLSVIGPFLALANGTEWPLASTGYSVGSLVALAVANVVQPFAAVVD